MTVGIGMQVLADKACEQLKAFGDTIEKLNESGCSVSLEAYYNGGSEGVKLNDLNGEFNLSVGMYQSLTD